MCSDNTVRKKEADENKDDKRHEPPNPDPPDSVQVGTLEYIFYACVYMYITHLAKTFWQVDFDTAVAISFVNRIFITI